MKIAALTMVFNERHFLPIWVNHYGTAIGRENLYVVDDGSDDGSTTGLGGVKVMRRRKALLDEEQRAHMIAEIQAELLKRYDAVIVSDVDELITPDPSTGLGLAQYVATRVDSVATAVGFNIQFCMHYETPLKRGIPLFRQRRFVQVDWEYFKTPVSRVPLRWTPGFHRSSAPPDLRNDLLLFHLRSVDPGITLDRLRSLNTVKFSERSMKQGESTHFHLTDDEYLRAFYVTRKEDFDAAQPKETFDSKISEFADRFRVEGLKSLFREEKRLMILPDRFADTIAVPSSQ